MFERNPSAHWQDVGLGVSVGLRLGGEGFNRGPQDLQDGENRGQQEEYFE